MFKEKRVSEVNGRFEFKLKIYGNYWEEQNWIKGKKHNSNNWFYEMRGDILNRVLR